MEPKVPLFVDLDDALLATDLLAESFVQAVKLSPATLVKVPRWLLQGKAHLKHQLAKMVRIDVESLPYRTEVLEFLREENARGRQIILATASDRRFALAVAEHLGIFHNVLASDGVTNLKGETKQKAIAEYCQERDLQGYAYVGDSHSDLVVWGSAEEVYLVAPNSRVLAAAKRFDKPLRVFDRRPSRLKPAIQTLRPQQWSKNLLVLVPLFVGHEVGNAAKVLHSLQAFVVFCLAASSVYVMNDVFDLQADRKHEQKKNRPIASGRLPIIYAPVLTATLLLLGITLAATQLPPHFLTIVGIYLALNVLYSFWLKSKLIVDVVLLSTLYNLRVLSGGTASGITVSEWLFAFGMFMFTSLAFTKRYSELSKIAADNDLESFAAKGRGYVAGDVGMVGSLGTAAGLTAVLVFTLYIHSDEVRLLYNNSLVLSLICPLLLYWVGRIWLMAGRGELREDPVAYAILDWRSWVVAVLAGLVMLAAAY